MFTLRKSNWPFSCKIVALAIVLAMMSIPIPIFILEGPPVFLAFFAIFIWLLFENGLGQLNKTCRFIYGLWLSLCILMVAIGLVENRSFGAWGFDLGHIVLFSAGAVFAHRSRWAILMQLFVLCSIIGIISGIYGILLTGFTINPIPVEYRSLRTWEMPYFLWMMLFHWPLLLFATLFHSKKFRFLAIGTLGLHFILGLIFLKRVIYFDMAVFVAIALSVSYATRKSNPQFLKNIFRFSATGITIVVGAFVISFFVLPENPMIDSITVLHQGTIVRILVVSADTAGDDRIFEVRRFFDEIALRQLIFGSGLGSTHAFLNTENAHIHIGWANFIFKGGVLLFLLFAFGAVVIVKRMFSGFITNYGRVFSCTAAFFLFAMGISTIWGFSPVVFLFGACFFSSLNAISKKKR